VETPTTTSPIQMYLREAFAKTDLHDYDGAMSDLETASALDPGNIYLGALKRQVAELSELERKESLDELTRHELIALMPGIIECALRESNKQRKPGNGQSATHPSPNQKSMAAPKEDPAIAESSAQKELEGLKLLYFQRASKFVMKGEYEAALAEVQRVFEVDPNNTIAREYAAKVENLIDHARQLASPDHATSQPIAPPNIPPTADDPDAHDSQRVSSWADSVAARKAAPQDEPGPGSRAPQAQAGSTPPSAEMKPISQRAPNPPSQRMVPSPPSSRRQAPPPSQRMVTSPPSSRRPSAPPSQRVRMSPQSERVGMAPASQRRPSAESRQTVAFGDSLLDVLAAPLPEKLSEDRPSTSRTTLYAVLAAGLIVLAAGGYFVFGGSGKQATATSSTPSIESGAAATIGATSAPASTEPVIEAPEQTEHAPTPVVTPNESRKTPEQRSAAKSEPAGSLKKAGTNETASLNLPPKESPKPATVATQPKVAPAMQPAATQAQTDAPPVVPDFVAVEKEPEIVKLVKPVYPELLKADGQVVIKVLIDTEGKPVQTKILKSTNKVFEQAVVNAVMKSTYSPAQMGQGPVAAWLTIPFRFKQAK
jgi:TonB family protein